MITTERCSHGPKVRYPTRDEAETALLDCRIGAALRGNQRRREARTYRCHNCRGWHLSSSTY
ncbi:hypothetical protein [Saccharopolyspora sp. 6V]|uniref:hypothetical protein n=1 Tax=Saccharopolyspora sp. 6V TaxID=2877239 RepID=UPI001CD6AE3A|nr:hypothetical protein [Saccharopolyspora sp. 6V]MCA1195109.1 hypothetical protein [Saccharopolyspora sp. 6V]